MKLKIWVFFIGLVALLGLVIYWQPVFAAPQEILVPTDGTKTVKMGKQGLFLSNLPPAVRFVEVEKLLPPLRPAYTYNIEIAYRGPVLDITFLNEKLVAVSPSPTLTSVYFNVSEPEVAMWEEGGTNAIAIWFYNKKTEEWRLCHPRLIPEKQINGKYDRLACFVMGNGIYVLGKMEADPMFPLWFKPHDLEARRRNFRVVEKY